VLHPELAASLGPARFLQEIQVTARLQHPHILPLLDSGEANGLVYYLMPYVTGESLRDRLRRDKQLPIEDAVTIAREVALALDYAHRQGVIHRDVKPENILLSDGQALVADFGVARAVEAAGRESLTESGLALGTPAYMSPEQAAAEPDLDGRSDTYSLGCVLYEMLAGDAPFSGSSPRAIAARHSLDAAPSVRSVRPTVSAAIERVIHRAMAKVPADRYATAAQFAEALGAAARGEADSVSMPVKLRLRVTRRTGILATVAVGAMIAAGVWRWQARAERGAPISSLAVVPLVGTTPDTSIEYLVDGITETLINSLSSLHALRVTARSAVSRFRGRSDDPSEIGRTLGVQAVLTWSLQRRGDGLHVQTELVRVADDARLWGAQYDRPTADVLELQQQLAQAVVQQVRPEARDAHAAVEPKRPTTSREAFELYSRARFLLSRRNGTTVSDKAARDMAREYYEEAIAKDPAFALAWSGLAAYYSYEASETGSQEDWDKAEMMARRALAIDSTSGDAWAELGVVLGNGRQDDEGAGRAFARGAALGPRGPSAYWLYGEWLLMRRRFDEAIEQMEKAIALDPVDFASNAKLGWALLIARRYDRAVAQLKKTAELQPNDFAPYKLLAFAYEREGRYAEASAAMQRSLLRAGDTAQASALARAYAARGVPGYWQVRRASLLDTLLQLRRRARAGDEDLTQMIWTYAQLGDRQHAFGLLDRIGNDPVGLRNVLWIWLMDSLRSDPRFGELVRKAGLPLIEGER